MRSIGVYTEGMDTISPLERSRVMARVKGKDTRPERVVRSLLHRSGFRFRVHAKNLPGQPDIVLPKYRVVVFIHGCFWHRHPGCKRASTPSSNTAYWMPKFARTVNRDASNAAALAKLGWRVATVWECELRDLPALSERLIKQIKGSLQ